MLTKVKLFIGIVPLLALPVLSMAAKGRVFYGYDLIIPVSFKLNDTSNHQNITVSTYVEEQKDDNEHCSEYAKLKDSDSNSCLVLKKFSNYNMSLLHHDDVIFNIKPSGQVMAIVTACKNKSQEENTHTCITSVINISEESIANELISSLNDQIDYTYDRNAYPRLPTGYLKYLIEKPTQFEKNSKIYTAIMNNDLQVDVREDVLDYMLAIKHNDINDITIQKLSQICLSSLKIGQGIIDANKNYLKSHPSKIETYNTSFQFDSFMHGINQALNDYKLSYLKLNTEKELKYDENGKTKSIRPDLYLEASNFMIDYKYYSNNTSLAQKQAKVLIKNQYSGDLKTVQGVCYINPHKNQHTCQCLYRGQNTKKFNKKRSLYLKGNTLVNQFINIDNNPINYI